MKMKKVLENQGLFMAEKERFELSRRLYPTYTLSRGASSANLSTSPCTCERPLQNSHRLLYIIWVRLSIVFRFFDFLFLILSVE